MPSAASGPVFGPDHMHISERMICVESKISQLLKAKLVPALLSIVLGIVIVVARRAAVDLLIKIAGGLVIAAGVLMILRALAKRSQDPEAMKVLIPLAVIALLTGILLIRFAGSIVDIFPILIGVCLILNGISHLAAAFAGQDKRIPVIITGAVITLLGLIIVCRPGFLVNSLMVFIGAALIVNGVMDLLAVKQAES